jgi:peptide methionine sulfoxide reductase msrA/msrB
MTSPADTKKDPHFVKPAPADMKKKLTPLQFDVTQKNATEKPFDNPYWDNKEEGIYVDVVTGEPLFSTTAQYHSGTGWPSFTEPIDNSMLVTKADVSTGAPRTEIRSAGGDSHLGHVFDDGPGPGGKRFCVNSAALRFIPVARIEKEGYGRYLPLFSKKTKEAQKTPELELATFAGGCFWCMEPAFAKIPGVISQHVGYTGGAKEKPTYEEVCSGKTGHVEAVQISFDPRTVNYAQLLAIFWHNIDPTVENRQFCDVGTQYRTGIFYHNDAQRLAAVKTRDELAHNPKITSIKTEITAAGIFYPAEAGHQQYYLKNPEKYKAYRAACERDQRLEFLWKK